MTVVEVAVVVLLPVVDAVCTPTSPMPVALTVPLLTMRLPPVAKALIATALLALTVVEVPVVVLAPPVEMLSTPKPPPRAVELVSDTVPLLSVRAPPVLVAWMP